MSQNASTALTVTQKQQNLKSMLIKALPSLRMVAAKVISPDRLIKIALVAASRRPGLLNCTPTSILSSLISAAEVGLEPETPLQHAYLVPFKNKNGTLEATFMPSARGLAAIAKRSGDLVGIRARLVYEHEAFDVEEGLEPRLYHKPLYDEEARGNMIAGYAVAVMKDGSKEFDVMTRAAIEKVRMSSKSPNEGPWVDWADMMARKTVLKRLLRQLPVESEQLSKAVEHDDAAEREDAGGKMADVIPMIGESISENSNRSEQVAAEVKGKKGAKAKAAEKPAPADAAPLTEEEERRQILEEERAEAARARAEKDSANHDPRDDD